MTRFVSMLGKQYWTAHRESPAAHDESPAAHRESPAAHRESPAVHGDLNCYTLFVYVSTVVRSGKHRTCVT